MGESIKVLAQALPVATTQTTLYTVPGATSVVSSSVAICNQNSSTIRFRLRVNVGGAADDPKQFLYYDMPLLKNETYVATIGMTLGAGDVVKIQADAANVSFNLFGVEST